MNKSKNLACITYAEECETKMKISLNNPAEIERIYIIGKLQTWF